MKSVSEGKTPSDAVATGGEILRRRREERGLTQKQVVSRTSVPVAAYLSDLEHGKVNLARSKHLESLARALCLNADDLRQISPTALSERQYTVQQPGVPDTDRAKNRFYDIVENEGLELNDEPPVVEQLGGSTIVVRGMAGLQEVVVTVVFPRFPQPSGLIGTRADALPTGLEEAVQRFAPADGELQRTEWLHLLSWLTSLTRTVHSADEFYDLFRALSRFGIEPPPVPSTTAGAVEEAG